MGKKKHKEIAEPVLSKVKDLPSHNDKEFFPKIYRFITESWKLILSSFASGLILIAIILQSLNLYNNLQQERKTQQERGQVEKELAFWKKSLTKYKDHRDIYYKIATLEYRLGNTDKSKENLKKALEIDPNFKPGLVLGAKVGM